MNRVDGWAGAAIAALGAAVLWGARDFPVVPGQNLGAGFVPRLVALGLLACGALLLVRAWRTRAAPDARATQAPRAAGRLAPALAVVAAVLAYILLADRLGFLIVAPAVVAAVLLAFEVRWPAAIAWALGCTAIVHLTFYKMLSVPLPWGVLRPFY